MTLPTPDAASYGITFFATVAACLICWLFRQWRKSINLMDGYVEQIKRREALHLLQLENANAEAWCCGWQDRAAYEECLREAEWNSRAEKLKGMVN